MAKPSHEAATYEQLKALPDNMVGEILDGELFVSPRPASPHAHAAALALGDLVGPFHRGTPGPGCPGGWWLLMEPELHFRGDVLVSDLAGWRRERMPAMPDVAAFELAPDWVCEVLSPSTAKIDKNRKWRIYAREGVAFLWFVEPHLRVLDAFRLDGGSWTLTSSFSGDEKARIEPFAEVELDLSRWWLPEAK